ncbi:MAG: DedA family protein [Holosporales bacterium]|jgi:membrane protein DedA with SNARE-associated domain|nr:DedA family protein [Holosporales bacterium]
MFGYGDISELIREWGYWAVFVGALFEGEIVLVTASAFAACGHLEISKVFFIALLTTIVADQILFWIGYNVGTDWIIRRIPKLEKSRERVFVLLHKMDILFIFAFRFIYGIRTISPLIIGSAKVKPPRFIIYNILSGLCWASVGCFLGYTVGDIVDDGKCDLIPTIVAIMGIVIITIGGAILFCKARLRKRSG